MNISIECSGQLLFRDNRLHACVDSTDEVEESDEDNNIITTQAEGTDLSASLLSADGIACPNEIGLAVRIGNAGNASVSAGVPMAFYDGEPGNDGVLIGTVTTFQAFEPGQYRDLTLNWFDPPAGMRMVYVQADDDGTGSGALSEIYEENNRLFSTLTICAAPVAQANGISGQVIDAVTGDFLSGATVSLHQEENGSAGALVLDTVADEYGGYLFSDLVPGDYFLVAELTGYVNVRRSVALALDQALTHQDLVLSPALGSGELRIVLTWGEQPSDLEAHLTAPNAGGCRHHCFYWNKTIPGASLDVDDMDSYGPETITISQLEAGTYRFYVHDFSNRLSRSSAALSTSGATVTVYSGDGGAPEVFKVPTGAGNVWRVFNLNGVSGTITPIDKMTHQDKPGNVDFPNITSLPVTSATYKGAYAYQIEAEDPDQDMLTYSLIKGPEGMQLDPFSGLIPWIPMAGQGQWQDVEIRVSDGRCGQATQTFRIHLTYLPMVQFEVSPCSGMNPGGEITLTWQTERADTVVIDQGIGDVHPDGSLVVDPDRTTTYTITASGPGGTVTSQVTLTCLAPTASIQADPATIIEGHSSTLSWQTAHASTTTMAPVLGTVDADGTISVSPTLTTTYTVTASGRGGTASAQATVTVITPPSIDLIEPDGVEDRANASFTIRWTDRDPDSDALISLYYDINNSGADGTLIVDGLDENADGLDDQTVWDTSGIPDGDYYVYAVIDDGVNAPMVAYGDGPITIDHAVTDEIKLTAGDGMAYDAFGGAVSIDGDFTVVGVTEREDGGAAYIFKNEGSAWEEQIISDVAISGDTATVGEPNVWDAAGAVYLFTRTGDGWLSQDTTDPGEGEGEGEGGELPVESNSSTAFQKLIPSDGQADDYFGVAVAMDEQHVIVGAFLDLEYHQEDAREWYAAIYNALGADLATLAGKMQDISLICYVNGLAKYRIRQNHEISGKIVTIAYYIYFSRDGNGLWLIEKY